MTKAVRPDDAVRGERPSGPLVEVRIWNPGFSTAEPAVRCGATEAMRGWPAPRAGGCVVISLADEGEVARPDEWFAGDGRVFATQDAVAALHPVPFVHVGGERSSARWRLVGEVADAPDPASWQPDEEEPATAKTAAPPPSRMLVGPDVRDPWLRSRPFAEIKLAKTLAARLEERGVLTVADAQGTDESAFADPPIKGIPDPGKRIAKALAREAQNKDAWIRRRPTLDVDEMQPPETREAVLAECRRIGLFASIHLAAKRYPEGGQLLVEAIGLDGEAPTDRELADRLGVTVTQVWERLHGLARLADMKSGWPGRLAAEIEARRNADGNTVLDEIQLNGWWAGVSSKALVRAVRLIHGAQLVDGSPLDGRSELVGYGHVVAFRDEPEASKRPGEDPEDLFAPFEPPSVEPAPAEAPPEDGPAHPAASALPAGYAAGSLADAVASLGECAAGAAFLNLGRFRERAGDASEVLAALRGAMAERGALFLSVPSPFDHHGMPETPESLLRRAGFHLVEEIGWTRTAAPAAACVMEKVRQAEAVRAGPGELGPRRGFGRILVASPTRGLALVPDPAPKGSEGMGMSTNGGSNFWSAAGDGNRLPVGIATMCLRLVGAMPGSAVLGLDGGNGGVAKACDILGMDYRAVTAGAAARRDGLGLEG